MVDYRSFRFSKLNTPEFSHLWLLLFWPIYGIFFGGVERAPELFGFSVSYTPIYCPLDDLIPFCEYFIIPYYLWFAYLIGMLLYTLLFDTEAFRRGMWFIIITYSIAILTYILFPNCQELRPTEFVRDNICVDVARFLYQFDTNTNVCPSIHVLGSVAVLLMSWKAKHFTHPVTRTVMTVLCVLISISTVFLRQHSVIDLAAAAVVCAIAYPFVFCDSFRARFFLFFRKLFGKAA